MPEVRLHDASTIPVEIRGDGPALLLPVNPQPVEGPQAEEMRRWGADPELGPTLIGSLSDAFQVVAFDYEGHVLQIPKRDTLTPDNVAGDLLAVADAAGADAFAYYGYSWLAVAGLQLALRTGRLSALAMGGFPPLDGPYAQMLQVTTATHQMAVANWASARANSASAGANSASAGANSASAGANSASAGGTANATGPAQPAEEPPGEPDWSQVEVSLTPAQTGQFVTFYEALRGFDDRAAQAQLTCPRLCFVGSADEITYDERWGGLHVSFARPVVSHRAELEALGWQVQVLEGLDHTQAMQAARVVPILRPWLVASQHGAVGERP